VLGIFVALGARLFFAARNLVDWRIVSRSPLMRTGEENIREAFQETLACALLECPARSRHRPTLDDRAAQCWLHIG
jgi:hypothetical protein